MAQEHDSMSKPLTFGELSVGDAFISFPWDGDDSGHGGYRGHSYLFTKIPEGDRGNSIRGDGAVSHMPNCLVVIHILK